MAGLEFVVLAVPAAAVARLVFGLISDIVKKAETARQNKLECNYLKRHVSQIGRLLLRLQLQDPEVAEALAGLRDTLQEAHVLVVACQKSNMVKEIFSAGEQAMKFTQVNGRIDSHLLVIQLLSQISITHRLDRILSPNHTSILVPSPGYGDDYGSGSRSLQLKESAKVPYVGSTSMHAVVHFTSAEIAVLTGNYGHVLSEDSSGTVYKGILHDGQEVAVKSLKNKGSQREGAFVSELETLSQLRHDHILRLVGWCSEDDDRMFIYQYQHMSNGTLRDHLTKGGSEGSASASPVTSSWKARLQTLLGVAGAIDYLHRFAVTGIIHRNVSSSSILLDKSCVPCLSDFGAAILQVPTTGGQHVGDVVGRVGYTDPEYCRTRCVSPASDVYSFGVVILEVLTGRPPSWEGKLPNTLVGFAVPIIKSGNLRSVLDRRPSPKPTPRQMEALELVAYTATRCLWQQDRPFMANVVINLHTALGLIDGDEPKRLQWS
ncbi:hypothetical protein CFC21_032234 [Triticum aestivum]|uniref:Protein kinase domain-containing protein n=2 Tax=Triticum aestivum TaxID=4565 RepID=A0A9R1EYU7_WHEAT|nr:putative serine/threonine-protein kinase-like protein CCR3 [Triticum aestivum]KAF7019003.1 hypothetical protein CFC21_032234 [Triticum aestivum]